MDERFEFNDGTVVVVVTGCTVYAEDADGGHLKGPSNVDYYYSERGYECANAEEVARQFYANFFQASDPVVASDEMIDEALVSGGSECPNCDEDRMDYLTWDEDGEFVTCFTCGTEYVPGQANDTMVAPDGTIAPSR